MSELKTCFKKVDYDLSGLLHYIDIGDIGLPDIQRPFVWSNTKVRDLFDSMYRGFPVGYFLFWENALGGGSKQIGVGIKQHAVAQRLIVDGQQRLTSLFAVFRGRKVLDEDYRERQIEIAFRPRDGSFEVADAAVRKDPEWIPNISVLLSSAQPTYQMVKSFLKQLAAAKGALPESLEDQIGHNLDRLLGLQNYPFTALEIAATVDEEQVADIFVRINSEGVRLNQADFILTLMSVFWDGGRRDLELFCRSARQAPSPGGPPSPFNHFIQPEPAQLLRVAVAVGFERGRMKSVYQVLRGKDMDTGELSTVRRDEQFVRLQTAQIDVLDLKHWHQFLSCLIGVGFRSGEMISSQSALLYAYAFYLIGRKRFALPEYRLQRLIGRWFFAASLTGRYTTSPESVMDSDLNRLKELKDGESFETALEENMANELTNDFWTVTLPFNLDSSSARNPELFAYTAAQNRLGSPVLFSHKRVADMLDPALKMTKKSLERHHLFPRAWLERNGLTDLKQINQLANFALLEWPDNIDISDTAPGEYVPKVRSRFSTGEWARMNEHHALPSDWERLSYPEFLVQRRRLMAAIIRRGFESVRPSMVVAEEQEATEVELRDLPSVAVSVAAAMDDGDEESNAETTGKELTPAKALQLDYWNAFLGVLRARGKVRESRSPQAANWMAFPFGNSRGFLWTSTNRRDRRIGVGAAFKPDPAKELFRRFYADREAIHRDLGFELSWDERAGDTTSFCGIYLDEAPTQRESWVSQHEWMADKLETLQRVFRERVARWN
jgi:hypothetical protein